ncbi:MAG: phosphoenolpyruvate synthase [Verrucomicrobiales bacterium]|nr:phosphoenolpyruvate synthase [Verrucomicrobiales bacterium]
MTRIYDSANTGPPGPEFALGGKAEALVRLTVGDFPVPRFYVCESDEPLPPSVKLDAESYAVRSSAIGEDSGEHSFAGQFESYLFVKPEDIPARIADVIDSANSERVAAYLEEKGEGGESVPQPRVIIQEMIDASLAGVAFSADPVSNDRDTVVISFVEGTAADLVSGDVEGETIRLREGEISDDERMNEVADLARRSEAYFGAPQDIEWCFDAAGKLWIVQSRPITTLRDPVRIWDNSNIAESYSGVTSPLTFSFAKRIYAEVYRQFCRVLAVPRARIEASDSVFNGMLDQIRGRIYYDLVNWYRVLALLPGFSVNREFMEGMMGVKKPFPPGLTAAVIAENRRGKFADTLALVATVFGLIRQAVRLEKTKSEFYDRLDDALKLPERPFETMSREELIADYEQLEDRLLKKWDAPLINDFLAMIGFGVLQKLAAKWTYADPNELVSGTEGMISLEPARRIRQMAEKAAAGENYEDDFEAYLEKFGDRCLEELKLESATLRDDPAPLRVSIERLADRLKNEPTGSVHRSKPVDSYRPPSGFFRKRIFPWVLGLARNRIRDRENLRFERTRLFGRVRRIVVQLGDRYGIGDDIFFAKIEEVLADKIDSEKIAERKSRWAEFETEMPPPDRIESVTDEPAWQDREPVVSSDTEKVGTACCPGKVAGPARVVLNPKGVEILPGEILVARQTDPGWVMLFPAASGLLVERGSLLSHSAIVSRELGLPSVVGLSGLCDWIETGDLVEMDGSTGKVKILEKNG